MQLETQHIERLYLGLLRAHGGLLTDGQEQALMVRRREAGGLSALILLICQLEVYGAHGNLMAEALAASRRYINGWVPLVAPHQLSRRHASCPHCGGTMGRGSLRCRVCMPKVRMLRRAA